MSTETPAKTGWSEAASDAARRLFGAGAEEFARRIGKLSGCPMAPSMEAPAHVEAAALRLELPPDGAALVAGNSPAGAILLVLDSAAAGRLAALAPRPEANGSEAGSDPLDEAARQWATALAERRGVAAGSGEPPPGSVARLAGSVWQGGTDPLGAPAYASAKLTFVPEEGAGVTGRILAPEGLLAATPADSVSTAASPGTDAPADAGNGPAAGESATGARAPETPAAESRAGNDAAAPPAAEASANAAAGGTPGVPDPARPLVYCLNEPSLAGRVAEALPEADVRPLDSAAALVGRLHEGETPALVLVFVPEHGEKLIEHLAGLHRLPQLTGRRLMPVLENPVKNTVLHCGRSGLFDVLPAGCAPEDLRRRLLPVIQAPGA